MRARIEENIRNFFTITRLKRLFSAYIISYLGTFLSLSFLAIIFWSSVSSPDAIKGLIGHSGIEKNLILQLAEKVNSTSLNNGSISRNELKSVIDLVFTVDLKKSINQQFSNDFHSWVSVGRGPFFFKYDLIDQEKQIKTLNSKINTNFLQGGSLVIFYDSGESSIKLRPQRTYDYFWWVTLIGPILFVLLAIALVIFYRKRIEDLLFKIKRMLYYSCIAILITIFLNNIYWNYLANRMSTYPKAGLVGALSVKPITAEILLRTSAVASLSFVVYLLGFLVIKKFLKNRNFEASEEKHKNDVWEFVVKITKYYLKKLK